MTISEKKVYPRTGDFQTVYLKNVVTDSSITVGEYTMYNDFVNSVWEYSWFEIVLQIGLWGGTPQAYLPNYKVQWAGGPKKD